MFLNLLTYVLCFKKSRLTHWKRDRKYYIFHVLKITPSNLRLNHYFLTTYSERKLGKHWAPTKLAWILRRSVLFGYVATTRLGVKILTRINQGELSLHYYYYLLSWGQGGSQLRNKTSANLFWATIFCRFQDQHTTCYLWSGTQVTSQNSRGHLQVPKSSVSSTNSLRKVFKWLDQIMTFFAIVAQNRSR